jgi:hypothetical protein
MERREEIVEKVKKILPCTCDMAYTDRFLTDPNCPFCNYGEDIIDLVEAAWKSGHW